eukprot:m.147404 g.147404  ORF g.147404 m.147404 type:complete len:598 (-) comp30534_c0_seq1:64-1857(-)
MVMMINRLWQLLFCLLMMADSCKGSTICLVIPALPWMFGPYQHQGFLLSKQLHLLGYKVYWLPKTHQLPERKFEDRFEVAKVAGLEPPPDVFDDDHINYIGATTGRQFHKISDFNRLAAKYELDSYISLMDLNMVLNDEEFEVPAIAWYPNHFYEVPPKDLHSLSAFAAVASLCPSARAVIESQLNHEDAIVEFVPHIVDLNEHLWNVPKAQLRAKYHPNISPRTFLVLLQGGNYEPHNRKGWDTSILAFKEFQEKYPEIDCHLLIHAISSTEILADAGTMVGPEAQQSGIAINWLIEAVKLVPGTYTLDTRILPLEESLAYKRMADVMLHASKSEGFGMNVLETQAIGTPVVTTKFQAMDDFTKYGLTVKPVQKGFMVQGLVATPDVSGLARALWQIYYKDFEETLDDTREWLKTKFCASAVAGDMVKILTRLGISPNVKAVKLKKKSTRPKLYTNSFYTIVSEETPRKMNWMTPWTLSANANVEFNHEVIQALLSDMISPDITVIIIPVTNADGATIPLEARDGKLNGDLAILVRSHLFKNSQTLHASRRFIIMDIAGKARDVKQMPLGLAKAKVQGVEEESKIVELDDDVKDEL